MCRQPFAKKNDELALRLSTSCVCSHFRCLGFRIYFPFQQLQPVVMCIFELFFWGMLLHEMCRKFVLTKEDTPTVAKRSLLLMAEVALLRDHVHLMHGGSRGCLDCESTVLP